MRPILSGPSWAFCGSLTCSPGPHAVYAYRDSADFDARSRSAKRELRLVAITICVPATLIVGAGVALRKDGGFFMAGFGGSLAAAGVALCAWAAGVVSSFKGSEGYSVEWDDGEFFVHFGGRRFAAQVLREPKTARDAAYDGECRLTLTSEFGTLNFAPGWMTAEPAGD